MSPTITNTFSTLTGAITPPSFHTPNSPTLSTPFNLRFCPQPPFIILLHPPSHPRFGRKPTSFSSIGSLLKPPMASSTPVSGSEAESKPYSVLFVCLGNICRSPAAEGVFRDIVTKRGLDSKFNIDSAGTINYHEGNLADPRMRAASKMRNIEITSKSRPIRPSDFRDFDLILAMDNQNKDDIIEALNRWKFKEPLPEDAHKKVKLMCSYCKNHDETEVPDPYYGGPQGFEKVLDLLEDACDSLLDSIVAANSHIVDP